MYPYQDEFILTKAKNSMSASFSTSGAMSETHSSAYVPSGWLLPLNYLKVGREISGRSKIKLILPHSQGTATASGQVFPCYYEITYQLSRLHENCIDNDRRDYKWFILLIKSINNPVLI